LSGEGQEAEEALKFSLDTAKIIRLLVITTSSPATLGTQTWNPSTSLDNLKRALMSPKVSLKAVINTQPEMNKLKSTRILLLRDFKSNKQTKVT